MTTLRTTLRNPDFRLGVSDMFGTGVGVGAWGLVTGVAMVKSGMSVPLALIMSLLVYAGSAQLAVIPLLATGGPMWVVWLTAACVSPTSCAAAVKLPVRPAASNTRIHSSGSLSIDAWVIAIRRTAPQTLNC